MVLSKSNYLLFLRHPAWLWLEKNDKKKLPEIDDNTQAMFDAGHLFEHYAEKIFSEGVELGYTTDGEFNFPKYKSLPERTKEALDAKTKVIFQGRLEVDDITCIFDVLELNDDGTYNLYEIKSSTKVKPEHVHDLAFQTIVLENSGLTVKGVFVVHVNNEYIKEGEVDSLKITSTSEVTSEVKNKIEETKEGIEKAKKVMNLSEIPDISPRYLGMGAIKDWLNIYKTLNPDLDRFSIYSLCTLKAKDVGAFEDKGTSLIENISDDANLSVKQQRQVEATKLGERIIQKEKIKEFLDTLQFPLYFLDYETLAGVLPAYDGMRPYQQVPFQYSLHILRSPDGELEHTEYLHTENTLPVEQLAAQLEKDIGSEGTVLAWYQSFERKCNDTMGQMCPKYSDFLMSVNERMVDLMVPFSEGWFIDKDFLGSASIKYVLPALVPELGYKDLNIRDGNTAQRLWVDTVVNGKNSTKKQQIMDDLIKYCTLDTLAMVEIWKVLRDL